MALIISNNKGQALFYSFMLGVVIIILALALAGPVKSFVDTARNSDNLDCDNAGISNFDRAACVVADLTLFHFIGGLIFIGGAALAARIIFT